MNYYNIGASAERIRSLRKEFGYTQEQFAELLGMERSFLSRIESGKKGCSVDTFARISALFSVSLDYLNTRPKSRDSFDSRRTETCDCGAKFYLQETVNVPK